MRYDLFVYAAHLVFWLVFAAGDRRARTIVARRPPSDVLAHQGPEILTAPHSRMLVVLHMVAFALMYLGIERALFGSSRFAATPAQRLFGCAIILCGAALMYLARSAFASWRFRAEIGPGHELATTGPFRYIRHPIYAGLDLLSLGTAIWIPTLLVWLGAVTMLIAGDLRARAEEPLLERAFGAAYRDYRRHSWRFLPGVY